MGGGGGEEVWWKKTVGAIEPFSSTQGNNLKHVIQNFCDYFRTIYI